MAVNIPRVGVLSPGEMGSAIGRVLRDNGANIYTCVKGRSDLTIMRAGEAGFRELPSYDQLVAETDLLLSVLVPAEAETVAEQIANILRRTRRRLAYADCNAISPQTAAGIARLIEEAGSVFIDASIIGPAPRSGAHTRIYCSGPNCTALEALQEHGLDVRVLGPSVGQASGLKMVYAASTKGTTALWTELLVAARALGLEEALVYEFSLGRSDVADRLMAQIPSMPRRSRRWIGEMEEIAATFEDLGLTPLMLRGAADIFRLVGRTDLADQTSRQPDPALEQVLDVLAEHLRE